MSFPGEHCAALHSAAHIRPPKDGDRFRRAEEEKPFHVGLVVNPLCYLEPRLTVRNVT